MYDFGNTAKEVKKETGGDIKMRILGISGVFDTVPTQVFSPTTSFNVNLGSRGVHVGRKTT